MTDKTLQQLLQIGSMPILDELDYEMVSRANREIAHRFTDWLRKNYRHDDDYSGAWLRFLKENGIDDE